MEIYLVRHGIAADPLQNAAQGKSDSERELTPEGKEKTAKVAQHFARAIDGVSLILHSPYLRAKETAEIFHRQFSRAEIAVGSGLRPNDAPEQGLVTIADRMKNHGAVMVVGHEPHLSALTSLLLTGNTFSSVEFKKAGIAGFEWGGAGNSRLLFLLPPRFLLA